MAYEAIISRRDDVTGSGMRPPAPSHPAAPGHPTTSHSATSRQSTARGQSAAPRIERRSQSLRSTKIVIAISTSASVRLPLLVLATNGGHSITA
jgi:hypothetical protein